MVLIRCQNCGGSTGPISAAAIATAISVLSLFGERQNQIAPTAPIDRNPPREYVLIARYSTPTLRNWKPRFCHPVAVAASAPTIGSSIAIPTATRLLSPRKGTPLSFLAPGLRTSCAQPCLPAS